MYSALYRRLRPRRFADIVAQEHIVRTLQNQLRYDRVSHAYLFCGTRGTGKTSCAKVFAQAVNCLAPLDYEPCGACASCIGVENKTNLDIIEIDAASNNGVDNIRDLRDEIMYPPQGKRKVYIIDEVHMLSTGAFNALLKTLEEPPPHCMFILATTDPQRIPATIHSRLMRFDFHRISQGQMAAALSAYMADEGISIEQGAIDYVARLADGSMRDALSLLDRAAGLYFNEHITADNMAELLGAVDNKTFTTMHKALLDKNTLACLNIVADIMAKGRDAGQFVEGMIFYLRDLLVSPDNADGLMETAGLITHFSSLNNKMRNSLDKRVVLEVGLIEWAAADAKPLNAPDAPRPTIQAARQEAPKPPVVKPKAIAADVMEVLSQWQTVCREFDGPEASFMAQTTAGSLEDSYLYIVCDTLLIEGFIRKKVDVIENKLKELYNKDFAINIMAKEVYNRRHKKKYGIEDDFKYTPKAEVKGLEDALGIEVEIRG